MMNTKTLQEKAMLVRHSIHKTSFRKFDRTATHEVAENNGADLDQAGRFNKMLIARGAVSKIHSAANQAYEHHITNTLPWDDEGWRLLPAENYFAYTEGQRSLRDRFDRAVDDFMSNYSDHVEEAKVRLGKLFRESEYPAPECVRDRFSIEVKIRPLPNSEDIRFTADAADIDRIRREVEADLQEVITDAVADLWKRLYESLETMQERLTDYAHEENKRFFHSWVDNVREIVALISPLNFTGDAKLEEVRQRVEDLLSQHDNLSIKHTSGVAKEVADQADDILKQMVGYIGG